MDGVSFENWVKSYFEDRMGFKVKTTEKSHNFGADLILYKKDGYKDSSIELPERTIVQVKRYGQGKNIGISAIQQICAAQKHFNADKCIVATNRYFTSSAKQLAADNDVLLLDREYFFGGKKHA